MAFDKYILGIHSFYLTQALWGLWLCQFCSKVSLFFSISGLFWSHLYAQYHSWSLLWFLLGLFSRQVDVAKKNVQLSIGTAEYLLEGSFLPLPGHIQPFSVSASCDGNGISPVVRPGWDFSAPYQWGFETGKGNILGAGAKQSVIWCISDLTGQSPLPWKSLWWESQ